MAHRCREFRSPDPKLSTMRSENESRDLLVDRLRRHVDRLAGLIGPRHPGKPQAMEAALRLIETELADAGYQSHRLPYELADGTTVANLVAEIPGTDRADEIVLLGAHYDTIPTTPGADDNASAVAVLIESARLLRPLKPRRTIRFVAFACEEMPYFHQREMGSQVYARGCREKNERITAMLCLEMVGYFTNEGKQGIPPAIPKLLHGLFPKRGNFLAAVGNLRSWRLAWQFRRGFKRGTPFPLFSIVLPEVIHEIRRSDNASFWDQNYPALMLTDTSFLRNPHYHQPTDKPETLDYECMAHVTEGVAAAVAYVSRAP